MKKITSIQRVDLQVTILVALLVVIATSVVFFFAYTLSYRQMIQSLEDRVTSLAQYVDQELPSILFATITDHADMESVSYQVAKDFLTSVREISSAQYLYTATKNEEGELIYHIDGLPEGHEDFRKPGDIIEEDFQEDLQKALAGHIVMPGVIKNTAWGDVFVAYYPVHDTNNPTVTIGAIGVEFPANREYKAYHRIRVLTSLIILLTCIIASIISHMLFRRISNPHFKDFSNTDSLTGLKNRNAYDLDMKNLIQGQRVKKYALILADLNGLKSVNDHNGHKAGDAYIQKFAEVLKTYENSDHVSYRIGGDEFAMFFFDPSEDKLQSFVKNIKEGLAASVDSTTVLCSVSVGYALAKKLTEETWKKVQSEADVNLYEDKKAFYAKHSSFDNRRTV